MLNNEQLIDRLTSLMRSEFLNGNYADNMFDAPCSVEDVEVNKIIKVEQYGDEIKVKGEGRVSAKLFLGGGESKDGIDIDESESFSFCIITDKNCRKITEVDYIH